MRQLLSRYLQACTVLLAAAPFVASALAGPAPDGRAALVNGALITQGAYQAELKRVERLSLRGKRPAGGVSQKQALENLIVREILYQEAVNRGVAVSREEVAAEVARLQRQLPARGALESTLGDMGVLPGDLEIQLARGIAIQKFLDLEFAKYAVVPEAEVTRYYQDHPDEFQEPLRMRISHILVQIDPSWEAGRKAEGRAKIEAVRKRLRAGGDFDVLAQEHSECSSAKKGGDLGYFLPGQLARKMEDAARQLNVGEVSDVVEDRYGLHLLKLTELRPAALLPLDTVRGKILSQLRQEKELKALAPVVKKSRAAAQVEILLNENEP
jgi:peptidyl-prolyl cis-trans isomerase C